MSQTVEYVHYWGLSDRPFENTRNSRYYFESKDHIEALERMLYLVRDGNMNLGMLTGEIGSGKTLTSTVLLNRLDPDRWERIPIWSSDLSLTNILQVAVAALRGEKPDLTQTDAFVLRQKLHELLEERVETEGRQVVMLLDEAQMLDEDTLIGLKNLTNMGTEERNWLTLILVGQPELRGRIRALPQLDQRVSLRFHLNALDADDVKSYLRHRLRVAGHPTGELFGDGCAKAIYRETHGIPREINRICKLAMDTAFALERPRVGADVVQAIIRDLHRQDGIPQAAAVGTAR